MTTATETIADLTVQLDDGRTVQLSDLADDGYLVVFFYPKAFTGGCTAQACHFRDLGAEFAEVGASRVGVSRDDLDTQARFSAKHGFDFPLIADPDGSVAKAFGARRMGPIPSKRQTVVLGPDLRVLLRISSETNMDVHADDALAYLREQQAS
ncbi:MAG: peroxiredoxin [Nitriliruptor sp.]|nr:MAG: peroxiredoxin [Nitriliruptor sp.]